MTISLSSRLFKVAEGHSVKFSIVREGDKSLKESVAIATFPLCARPGTDYEHLEKIIDFKPDCRQVDLEIKIYADGQPEFDEFFEIRLFECQQEYPPPCGEVGEPSKAIVKIIDGDT